MEIGLLKGIFIGEALKKAVRGVGSQGQDRERSDSGEARHASSNVSSVTNSAAPSAVNSEAEGGDDMKFRARKKKKLTKKQLKDREARRRLRHIEWLNSPKGTPKPKDTDDEEE